MNDLDLKTSKKRKPIPPSWRLAARLAAQQGLSLRAITFALKLPQSTVRTFTIGWEPLPGQQAAEAEEQLRLVTLAEIGIAPDHPLASSAWEVHRRHATQLLTIAGEAERTLAARTGNGRAA